MIQFNLLPDVKKEYAKARRAKRIIMSGSVIVSGIFISIVLVLFSVVQVAQKKHISDLSADIKSETNKINKVENLSKILTVQNQLLVLPDLHKNKPETSRLFDYVAFVSPQQVKIQSLDFDYSTESLVLQGSADSIASVNKFVDNLKAATFLVDEDTTSKPPFKDVSTQLNGDNEKASFKIELSFEKVIFDNRVDVTMKLDDQTIVIKTSENRDAQ